MLLLVLGWGLLGRWSDFGERMRQGRVVVACTWYDNWKYPAFLISVRYSCFLARDLGFERLLGWAGSA